MLKLTKKNTKKKISLVKKPKVTPFNVNVVIMVDASGSMGCWRKNTVETINQQITAIKASHSPQTVPGLKETRVSIGTFNSKQKNKVGQSYREVSVIDLSDFDSIANFDSVDEDSYVADGGTPLYDAIIHSIDALNGASTNADAKMLIVITDGEENTSKASEQDVKTAIKKANATDKWTFAFCMPPNSANRAIGFGVPAGCVTEWETSQKGFKAVSQNLTRGITSTYTAYGQSLYSNKSYFAPQVDTLTKTAVKSNLNDVTDEFECHTVNAHDPLVISDYFRKQRHTSYEVGKGFYQLTKSEDVQDFKDIILMDNQSRRLYSGPEVRDLIGLPTGGTIKLNPNFSPKWTVFIRSTSWNRKLIPGTTALHFNGVTLNK